MKYSEYSEQIKKEHADIIFLSPATVIMVDGEYQTTRYDLIDTEKFLSRKYPNKELFNKNLFIEISSIYKSRFIKEGKEGTFKITDLIYGQESIGIHGPEDSGISNPLFVVKWKNNYILHNGYHRWLYLIYSGKKEVKCLVLDLDEDKHL